MCEIQVLDFCVVNKPSMAQSTIVPSDPFSRADCLSPTMHTRSPRWKTELPLVLPAA